MKIFAVGMNYLQHNKELHGALYKPDAPVIFTKADSSLLKDKKPLFLPEELGRIDYETELVVLRHATCSGSCARQDSPGTSARGSTVQQPSESGCPWRSSAISRPFISTWTSTARPFRRAVPAICSTRWMN